MNTNNSQFPLEWIQIAKGIGIFLVVTGHFYPEVSPAYWTNIKEIIYSFHMPLFFILSGYLYIHGKYSYRDLIQSKVHRLLYPFITIAATFFLIKYLAGQFVDLNHPVNLHSLYALLMDPVNSYMPILWFVHTLFLIFVIYPLAKIFLSDAFILLLMLAINALVESRYFIIGNVLSFMPFFVTGIIFRENIHLLKNSTLEDWHKAIILLAVFSLAYALQLSVNTLPMFSYATGYFIGVAGSLFVINISHAISAHTDNTLKSILKTIGYYSMTIYLFHILFESAVKISFFQMFKQIHAPFELVAFFAITSGIIFPLLLEKIVLRRYWVTKRLVLGIT